MTITTSDPVTAAFVAELAAGAPTEAQEVEGRWMLKGQPANEGAILIIDRYGLRVRAGSVDEAGEIWEDPHAHAAYLTGEAVIDLRRHLDGLWQCPVCDHWMHGAGICAMLCDWEDAGTDTTAPDPGAEEEQAR